MKSRSRTISHFDKRAEIVSLWLSWRSEVMRGPGGFPAMGSPARAMFDLLFERVLLQ